ncbi:MAG: hypothetical protein A2Y10_08315 [Planctomycetes bacterium GWF2_41_51]|nr:MAG: hypothetical protein A2Y10_08315 [Planctomycetes bacterium GWF2_41_51]HBG25846.1 hypothetical protein [Phycisphaerales bacterium]
MKNIYENTDYKQPMGLAVLTGTSAGKAGVALRKLEKIYGINNSANQVDILHLDAEGIVTTFPVPMVDNTLEHLKLGPNETASCSIHDSKTRTKAENNGELWPMEPDWHLKPGVAKDKFGSGGNPRTGNALGRLNRNHIRKKLRNKLRRCGDYCRQRQLLESSDNKIADIPITVIVCASFLGGFGNGTVVMILQLIRELAIELKLQVNIILLGMVMGSLEPTDKTVAARNQETLLRQLDACVVGQFKDIENKSETMELLCDSLLLTSNVNNFGEIDNFDKLIAAAANYIFGIFHTTLGNQILEKRVDIEESWPDDDEGGKLWAGTMSFSKIHVDVPRIIECETQKLMQLSLEHILEDNPLPEAKKEAELVTAEQMLVEKGSKNMACERLFRPDGNTTTHAVEDTLRIFRDRCGSRWGFNRCYDMANASSYILTILIPRNVKPIVTRQAQTMLTNVETAIANLVAGFLKKPNGFSFARQFLEAFATSITEQAEANGKKLNNAQARKKSIDDRLATGHLLVKRLSRRWKIFRFLSFWTKREIRNIFETQTEQAVRTRLEITARTELANVIFPELLKFTGEQMADLQNALESALTMYQDIKTESKRLEELNSILVVPLGIELVDKLFIENQFKHILETEGGSDNIFANIFAEFQGHFPNLLAFKYHEIEEIKTVLHDYSIGIVIRRLQNLNVIDVLEKYAASDNEKKALIAQAINESSGRLRTSGEGDRSIPTIKFIGIGDCHRTAWIEKMTNDIDKTDGQWKTFETGDKNTIIFFQQRAQISVSNIIQWTSSFWGKPKTAQQMIKIGPCPILALAPASYDNSDNLNVLAAMAFATDKIYQIHPASNNIFLNGGFSKIIERLKTDFSLCMDIYREFIIELINDYNNMVNKLNKFINQADSPWIEVIGNNAFVKTAEIATALQPHLSRLPEDIRKWLELTNPKRNPEIR